MEEKIDSLTIKAALETFSREELINLSIGLYNEVASLGTARK